ncbi:BFD-like [2Fe-2S] binding domain-containing protein [Dethiosulfatibacter aminovorans DSM 17477]|uniref:BFD-like [2Fe-2S] binding domain-containing protein n=2 Tax=Dethiosulfatibacter TaxID=448125 RepID=A0A1M6J4M9_9FIRM|nr:(2Fe-2S)-binding protein [Dethiosulfatibacter aminovorans]SHJ41674.1 BFD-like [2Fe-2S] binding domain-containing protein [Dethiosulfatibacter aminovorans DSM 17477]
MKDENVIVCRCSDVTMKELRDLIDEGYHTFEEIKRITRIGMGPCQGKTCGQIVLRELSKATGKPVSELKFQTNRPPIVGVKLNLIAKEARHDD